MKILTRWPFSMFNNIRIVLHSFSSAKLCCILATIGISTTCSINKTSSFTYVQIIERWHVAFLQKISIICKIIKHMVYCFNFILLIFISACSIDGLLGLRCYLIIYRNKKNNLNKIKKISQWLFFNLIININFCFKFFPTFCL